MEAFSALLGFCVGNSPVIGVFPSQRPVTRSFDISLICAWINGWVNDRDVGDLRRHRANYDVIVMILRYPDGCLVTAPFSKRLSYQQSTPFRKLLHQTFFPILRCWICADRNENVAILTKFSSAASDEKFIKITIFQFHWGGKLVIKFGFQMFSGSVLEWLRFIWSLDSKSFVCEFDDPWSDSGSY